MIALFNVVVADIERLPDSEAERFVEHSITVLSWQAQLRCALLPPSR
jgi:hypothetical protein